MNTQSEAETAQDFETLYLAYLAKYEELLTEHATALILIEELSSGIDRLVEIVNHD
jgi:hypothetical protein